MKNPVRVLSRPLLVTAFGAAALMALAGCSSSGAQEWNWTSAHAATHSAEAGRVPGLLPGDATDVRLRAELTGYGSQLSFESKSGLTASYCKPGAIGRPAADGSTATTSWWPVGDHATGWDCDRWQVFEAAGTYYGWDTAESKV